VQDGVNGFLTSRDELPTRMLELLSDQALRHQLGQKGRELALQRDWRNAEDDFVRTCGSLVETAS